jgi:hypothetical protein
MKSDSAEDEEVIRRIDSLMQDPNKCEDYITSRVEKGLETLAKTIGDNTDKLCKIFQSLRRQIVHRFQDDRLLTCGPVRVTALNLSTAISYESLKSSTTDPTSSSSLNLNVIQPL